LTTHPRPQAARAAELARYIGACPHDRVAVEEQDHAFYIIHLSHDEATGWSAVYTLHLDDGWLCEAYPDQGWPPRAGSAVSELQSPISAEAAIGLENDRASRT
jgi:hypothetical protein